MGRSKKDARKAKKAASAAAAPQVTWRDRGNKAFGGAEYARAVECYTNGLAEEPGSLSLLSNRSAAHAALKDYTSALADAEAALQADAKFAKGYLRKGDALEGLLRYAEAGEAYQAGLALDPESAALATAGDRLGKLLEELKLTEEKENEGSGLNPESDKFGIMVEWLRKGGARHPTLFMRYYSEDYRGVHALTKIPPETVCLYVPRSHIMTSDVARASDIGRKLIEEQVDLRSKHSFLACYLLEERTKGKDSFWWPYINMLPEHYRNVPINFTPEELAHLKGSFTVEKIHERRRTLRAEYDNICRHVPEFTRHSADDFVWARLVVITRIFGLHIDKQKTDGLVPYADMLNHKRPRETKWTFDQSMDGFTITSCKTLQRGDEVFDSYGRKCNSRYFVNYGFALEENEDNEAVLKVVLPKMDPQYKLKLGLLGGGELNGQREYQVPARWFQEKKTKELMSFLRLVHAQDAELVMLPSERKDTLNVDVLSIRNEVAVLEHLSRAADVALGAYELSLDELNDRLAAGNLDFNIRNAYVMVRGEMMVLQWFKTLAKTCVPMLGMAWKDLKKEAAKCYAGTEVNNYVQRVVVPLVKRGE